MILLHLSPALLSLLLLAAHFYRATLWLPMLLCAALLGLMWLARPWVARVLQAALLLGSLEWLRTGLTLAIERHQAQLPYLRLALILGVVTLLTGLSSLVVRQRRVRAYFKLDTPR